MWAEPGINLIDPCEDVQNLDFDRRSDLRRILERDKHTRIEGLCTERFFKQDLLDGSFPVSSTGWWFTKEEGSYSVLKFARNIVDLSPLDLDLLEFFSTEGLVTRVVEFDKNARQFYYMKFRPNSKQIFASIWKTGKEIYPKKTSQSPVPPVVSRLQKRMEEALDLLEAQGMLEGSAVERLFANCWMKQEAYWDIDAFVQYDGDFIAFEVKQKFPTRKGTFGLNVGLCNLFQFLSGLDIRVAHVILTKPIWNESFSAIDLYTKPEYRKFSVWIAAWFDRTLISRDSSVAPSKTSIYAHDELTYFHIQPTRFHRLKIAGEGPNNALMDFVVGKTKAITALSEIPKLR